MKKTRIFSVVMVVMLLTACLDTSPTQSSESTPAPTSPQSQTESDHSGLDNGNDDTTLSGEDNTTNGESDKVIFDENSTNSNPYDSENTSIANIQIANATDELLSQYEFFHEFINFEDGSWAIIWTDTVVSDFEFIKLAYEQGSDYRTIYSFGSVVHSIGEFTPEKPFLVKTHGQIGSFSSFGVSFVDADNVKKYFLILESMVDGSFSIHQFQNKIGG